MPGLEQNEYDRERDFYRDRGLPCPKDQVVEPEEDSKDGEMTPDANTNMDFHRFDEQVKSLFRPKIHLWDCVRHTLVAEVGWLLQIFLIVPDRSTFRSAFTCVSKAMEKFTMS